MHKIVNNRLVRMSKLVHIVFGDRMSLIKSQYFTEILNFQTFYQINCPLVLNKLPTLSR